MSTIFNPDVDMLHRKSHGVSMDHLVTLQLRRGTLYRLINFKRNLFYSKRSELSVKYRVASLRGILQCLSVNISDMDLHKGTPLRASIPNKYPSKRMDIISSTWDTT